MQVLSMALGGVGLAVVSGSAACAQMPEQPATAAIISPSGRLVCSQEAYMAYFAQVAQVGAMGLGYNETLPGRSAIDRLLAAYDRLPPAASQTVIVAGHFPSGQLFRHGCAAERCTIEEMAVPMFDCQTVHFNDCTDLAIQFRGKHYCLVGEADE
jgi:hypothetical protein